jgi:UDP-N-acetylmuramyl pentapeptide synthase
MAKCKDWPGRKVIFSLHDPHADVYATDVTVEPEELRFTVHLRVPRHLYPPPPSIWGGYAEIPPDTLYATLKTSPGSPNRTELWNSKELVVPVAGKHNLSNLLAAIAAAQETGMDLIEIAAGAKNIRSLPGTLAPRKGRKGTVLVDSSYSSNPTGVRAALDYLTIFTGKKKVMLFPGIIELGDESDRIHRELGADIARVCDQLILIKEEFAAPLVEGLSSAAANTEVLRHLDDGEILRRLDQLAGPDTVMLFEGRGTGRFLEAMG